MNTPTPTPRTDAATYPADCLGTTLVTNRDCSRALERELAALTGTRTCTHHTDQQRTACPVCLVAALTAERDELRAALALGQLNCDAAYDELRADCDELRADVVRLSTERDQLRAQLHALQLVCGTSDVNKFETWVDRANARAARAEAAETVALAQWNGALERAMKAEAERDHLHAQLRQELRAELAEMHKSFAGNVHTENRALQTELAAEREKAERYRLATLKLETELATEREKVRMLRAALENLCDEQNGAPLETRRDQWEMAMDEARAAIVATEDAK